MKMNNLHVSKKEFDANCTGIPSRYGVTTTVFKYIDKDKALKVLHGGTHKYYLSYPIKKASGKKRWLDAPQDELKELQYSILNKFLKGFPAHKCAVGFREGIGMVKGPQQHMGAKKILSLDIKDFFPALSRNHVSIALAWITQKKYPKVAFQSGDLDVLLDLVTYKGSLPQGSPTSPALSNLIMRPLDARFYEHALENGLIYTRYADDISFSSKKGDFNPRDLINLVRKEVEKFGLYLNTKKTRVYTPNKRMLVTGVVVNEKLSVPKWKWRNFRARLHNLIKTQTPIHEQEFKQLRGYAEWIRQLHPKRGQAFLHQLGKINLVPS